MAAKFKVGDLVWAKMKGFPAWPGKVIEPKKEVKKPGSATKKPHHFVFFFGSENYAWIPEDTCYRYVDHRNRFIMTTRIPKGFKEAIEAIEDAVKAMPVEVKTDLPSIEEELAQMFPGKSPPPSKDYSREPLAGKKSAAKSKNASDKKGGTRSSVNSVPKQIISKKSVAKQLVERSKKPVAKIQRDKKEPKLSKPRERKESKDVSARKSAGTNTPIKLKRVPMKRSRSPSEESRPLKKQKAMAKPSAAPFKTSTPETTRLKNRIPRSPPPDTIGPLSPEDTSASPFAALMSSVSSSATQIEESLLTKQPVPKSIIPTPMRIGFLGLGIMGQGIVMNLLRSGHEVTVWNRTLLKCREFVKAGALKGNSPAEVVQACDITFSCVADSTAVKDLVFGNSGVLQGISRGKCYVEMSTIDEETMLDAAEAITARGGVFLEAPVVGSRVPALEGQLIVLAAGDRKLFDDCFSCFEAIGKKSLFLGSDIATATRMKLIINMIMGSVMASLAEGMAMAEKVGLDMEDVAEVLALGALSCPTVIHKSQAILNQKYDPHFPLVHQQKDLRLALQLGDKVEQPLYVAAAANELYKKARRLGYGDSDISAVFRAASA